MSHIFNRLKSYKKITLAMSISNINAVKDKKDLPFNNFFQEDNQIRTVIPLIDKDSAKIKEMLENGDTESGKQYTVDFKNQLAHTTTKINTGFKPVTYRLGKVIQLELPPEWLDKYSKILRGEIRSDRSIIISRSPIDILRMSDCGNIKSCHSEGGVYFKSALQEALDGGMIAYVVKNEDLGKINLQDKEIFEDKSRGIPGITPSSRLRINRYIYDDKNHDEDEIAIPSLKEYASNGKNVPGFIDSVAEFVKEKQKWLLDEINEEFKDESDSRKPRKFMSSLTRRGGEYADNEDGELFNNFFKKDIFEGDVKHSSGASRFSIWKEEVNSFVTAGNSKLEHSTVYGDVQEYDEDLVNIDAGVSINFDFEVNPQMKDIIEEKLKKFFVYSYKTKNEFLVDIAEATWSDSYDLEDVTNITVNGNTLNIQINLHAADITDPDDVNGYIDQVARFERNNYEDFKTTLRSFMLKNDILQSDTSNAILSWKFKNISMDATLDNDEEYSFGKDVGVTFKTAPYIIYVFNDDVYTRGFNGRKFESQSSKINSKIHAIIKDKIYSLFNNTNKNQTTLKGFENNYQNFSTTGSRFDTLIYMKGGNVLLSLKMTYDDIFEISPQKMIEVKNFLNLVDNNYASIIESSKNQINDIVNECLGPLNLENFNWYERSKQPQDKNQKHPQNQPQNNQQNQNQNNTEENFEKTVQ